MSEETDVEISREDRLLEKTLTVRERIIDALTETQLDFNANVKDAKMANVLLTSMKDLDAQILKRKQIAVDERSNETNAATIAAIARKLAEDSARTTGSSDHLSSVGQREIPTPDPSKFGSAIIVEGELVQEENNTNYDNFMEIHSKANRRMREIDESINVESDNNLGG